MSLIKVFFLHFQLISILYKYARENLALVNIYIKDPAVTQIKRDQRVPMIWFIANVGGILGLTMGCSLVTIFEILHHVALMFFRTGKRSLSTLNRTVIRRERIRKRRQSNTNIQLARSAVPCSSEGGTADPLVSAKMNGHCSKGAESNDTKTMKTMISQVGENHKGVQTAKSSTRKRHKV